MKLNKLITALKKNQIKMLAMEDIDEQLGLCFVAHQMVSYNRVVFCLKGSSRIVLYNKFAGQLITALVIKNWH